MTVGEFLNYLEAQPIPDEELLKKEICFRFREANGSYNHLVRPNTIAIEDVERLGNKALVVTMGYHGASYEGEEPAQLLH